MDIQVTKHFHLKLLLAMFMGAIVLTAFHNSVSAFTITRGTNQIGLVGWWTFDGKDMPQGVARDVSGSGNNGNLQNIATTTFYTTGKLGQGLNFDGVNDAISAGTANSLNFSGDFTISAWYNPRDITGIHVLAGRANTDFQLDFPTDIGYWLITRNEGGTNVLYFVAAGDTGDNRNSYAAPTFDRNIWHNLTGVRRGDNLKLYLDGVLVDDDTDAIGDTSTAGQTFYIGRTFSSDYFFNGTLDDVRAYNRALSDNEVKHIYNQAAGSKYNATLREPLKTGLVGHWTFDGKDMPNGTVRDLSGGGATGNTVSIATTTFYATGKIGQGLKFDGNDDYVDFNDVNAVDGLSRITVSAWVRTKSDAEQHVIGKGACSGGDGQGVFELFAGFPSAGVANFSVYEPGGGGRDAGTGSARIDDGQWHFLAGTYDGTNVSSYVDGNLDVATNRGSFTIDANGFDLEIGGNCNGTNLHWNGDIDDVRVYNRAFTLGEIRQLYNQGAATKQNVTSREALKSGLLSHWTFDGKDMPNGVARDVSGNNRHGNLQNIGTTTFYAAGKIGQGLNFDGTNDYITTPANSSITTALTVAAWIYPTSRDDFDGIVVSRGTHTFTFNISSAGHVGTDEVELWTDAGRICESQQDWITNNTWHHVAVTYDTITGDCIIYRNGIAGSPPNPVPHASFTLDGAIEIGRDSAGDRDFQGRIDDVRIYNRVLSASELVQLYNLGR